MKNEWYKGSVQELVDRRRGNAAAAGVFASIIA